MNLSKAGSYEVEEEPTQSLAVASKVHQPDSGSGCFLGCRLSQVDSKGVNRWGPASAELHVSGKRGAEGPQCPRGGSPPLFGQGCGGPRIGRMGVGQVLKLWPQALALRPAGGPHGLGPINTALRTAALPDSAPQ